MLGIVKRVLYMGCYLLPCRKLGQHGAVGVGFFCDQWAGSSCLRAGIPADISRSIRMRFPASLCFAWAGRKVLLSFPFAFWTSKSKAGQLGSPAKEVSKRDQNLMRTFPRMFRINSADVLHTICVILLAKAQRTHSPFFPFFTLGRT